MAQAGVPVPAARARLPLFTAIYADIGDAQSIEQNLSTFSAHVVNVDRIARVADANSLVLLDELGSATDPEEGAALAVAVAEHFLDRRAWCIITTHLTSLKVYAAKHDGVLNAAVGFDEAALSADLRSAARCAGSFGGSEHRCASRPRSCDRRQCASADDHAADRYRPLSRRTARAADSRSGGARRARRNRSASWPKRSCGWSVEGRTEQQARTRELERQLKSLIEDFESQLRDTVKAIDDKTVAQKIARDSALRIARLKREFSEQFQIYGRCAQQHTGADRKDQTRIVSASQRSAIWCG